MPDKLAAPLGASTVLGQLLSRVPTGVPVALVGPPRDLPPHLARARAGLLVVREDPPGAGPAAAVAAGVAALAAAGHLTGPGRSADVVVVCAGDAPWSPLAVPALVEALRAAPPGVVCAVAVDAAGVPQPLLAAHRAGALQALLREAGDLAGRPARWLVGAPGEAVTVPVPGSLSDDVDTPEQLARARAREGSPG